MKSAAVILSLVAAAAAQDVAGLAQCGQTCANNMMASGKAKELGCKDGDVRCLCENANFIYGLRDCSKAICSEQDAEKVVAYGVDVCKKAGVAIAGGNGGSGGDASSTGGSGGDASSTGGSGSDASSTGGSDADSSATGTDGGSGGAGGAAQVTTLYSVYTTDGKEVTSAIATSTIEGESGSATGTEGGAGGAVVTTFTSDGSQIVETLTTMMSNPSGTDSADATATGTEGSEASSTEGSGGSEQTSEGGSGASSTSSKGLGAQVTAAPGILAAAGLAALLL